MNIKDQKLFIKKRITNKIFIDRVFSKIMFPDQSIPLSYACLEIDKLINATEEKLLGYIYYSIKEQGMEVDVTRDDGDLTLTISYRHFEKELSNGNH